MIFRSDNSGTATIQSDLNIIVVSHGLDMPPTAGDVMITPLSAWGLMTQFYVTSYTPTTFTIQLDQAPGQDVTFAWKAGV